MKILIYILGICSLLSCQKYLEFEGDVIPSKLVVNSIFTKGDVLRVHLSHSRSQLDEAPLEGITNGSINVFNSEGVNLGTLNNFGDGIYESSFTLENLNSDYELQVSAPTFTSVNASSSIPVNSLSMLSATVTTAVSVEFNETDLLTKIEFQESPTSGQYYGVGFEMGYLIEGTGEIQYYGNYPYPNDGLVTVEGRSGNQILFKDDVINGLNEELVIRSFPDFYDVETDEYVLPVKIRITVRSFSYEAYQYLRSYDLYTDSQWDILATPVQVFSNVENGLGVFGGYNEKTFELDF